MEQPKVQILVVVASIQMRTLKTEVGNVSMPTVIGHGLVGPKEMLNCRNSSIGAIYCFGNFEDSIPKGKVVKIPLLRSELGGNTSELPDVFRFPEESFLFFFTIK